MNRRLWRRGLDEFFEKFDERGEGEVKYKPGQVVPLEEVCQYANCTFPKCDCTTSITTGGEMNILEKANELVNGDRQQDYGDAHENHERIARLWNAWVDSKDQTYCLLNATDVAIMMALVKVARLMESPNHTDSYVDLAGYAQVAQRCAEVDYGNEQDV